MQESDTPLALPEWALQRALDKAHMDAEHEAETGARHTQYACTLFTALLRETDGHVIPTSDAA